SIESKSRSHYPGVSERSHDRAYKPESGCAICGATAYFARAPVVKISVIVPSMTIPDGRTSQHDGNSGAQIPCFGRGHLCAALGIELQMLSLGDVHSFEASFHLFLNPVGRHNLVKHDAELLIKECRVSSLFPKSCESGVHIYTLL